MSATRRTHNRGITSIALLLALIWARPTGLAAKGQGEASRPAPDPQAEDAVIEEWMAHMSAAEKVGQLFIVAFSGHNPSPASRAGQLIQQSKVGGVVLITSNHNLVNNDDTPAQVAVLSNKLQSMAMGWDLILSDGQSLPGSASSGSGIPLFIAVDHEGDGYPYTRITGGVTPLPNSMAVGATWDTGYAEQVGEIVGRELAAMGVNMLLGPVLDVLSTPRPGGKGDAGTRVFGGDPYWVSEMGRAYVRGVHAGGEGRVITVAKHFPGHGGSDRLPDDEIATVDKSLLELERVELPPFFAVTRPDADGLVQTEGLMSSHIRYRGFYGDIRQFTGPVSLDEETTSAILDLEPLRAWREDGVLVSDSLGVPAVRKYFDPQLQTFPHRQIARQAFLAGNDLLILSQFALVSDWTQQYDNAVEVVDYFREQYESDPAFAARVDASVQRILRLKLKLHPPAGIENGKPSFAPEDVLIAPQELPVFGLGLDVVDEIARRAVTVLHPSEDSLPRPPRVNEDILILTEERLVRECFEDLPECEPRPLLSTEALQQTILRIYGPEGSGQVSPDRIHTRTFGQLKALLNWPVAAEGASQDAGDIDQLLRDAEWIVFVTLDPNPAYPDSDALQLFLSRNAPQIYHADVIVLAYTAPYYLDATEISKLTAYYVFYSKTAPFVEASARTLFGEVKPRGRSPVSIEGTTYDLSAQLSPDPTQQIVLVQLAPEARAAQIPVLLRVQTETILDHNGNRVPDGTQVRFVARDASSDQILDTVSAVTEGGAATGTLSIERPGQVIVIASSGESSDGRPLTFQALPEPTATAAPPSPTPTARSTSAPTPTSTITPSPTIVQTPTPTLTPTPRPTRAAPPWIAAADAWQGKPVDLLAAAVATSLVLLAWGLAGRRIGAQERSSRAARWARVALLAWVGALVGLLAWGWVPLGEWIALPTWVQSGLVGGAGAVVGSALSGRRAERQDRTEGQRKLR